MKAERQKSKFRAGIERERDGTTVTQRHYQGLRDTAAQTHGNTDVNAGIERERDDTTGRQRHSSTDTRKHSIKIAMATQ